MGKPDGFNACELCRSGEAEFALGSQRPHGPRSGFCSDRVLLCTRAGQREARPCLGT